MLENWKDIPGWEGLYKISDKGRVLSVRRKIIKVLDANNFGYKRIQCARCENGKKIRERFFVHRLVASLFVPGYFEGAVVNHKDLNKANNNADNLEWVTPSQNMLHAYAAGVLTGCFKKQPYELRYKDGRVSKFSCIEEAEEETKLKKSSLRDRVKKHNGYIETVDAFLVRCESND